MEYLVKIVMSISTYIARFFTVVSSTYSIVGDVLSGIGSIISTMRYGAVTMFTNLLSLIKQIFEGFVFNYLPTGFNYLSVFIGGYGTIFLMTLLFIIIVRIGIAFVFKILKLNLDYKRYKK